MGYIKEVGVRGTDYDLYSDLNAHQVAPEYSSSASYAVGDYCVYDLVLYRCTTAITSGEAWTSGHWTAVKLGQEVSDLKENLSELETDISNGNFPEMAVGSADQLISDEYVVENEPYQFRRSGGSANIGTRMEDVIVGGTVAWNQLNFNNSNTGTDNDVTFTKNDDGSWTLSGTASAIASRTISTGIPVTNGHKYLLLGGLSNNICVYVNTVASWEGTRYDYGNGAVLKCVASNNVGLGIQVVSAGTQTNNAKLRPQLFDLTAMFGSIIADYIYSLEQANQGDGVAWFKKLFSKDYYAYNAGELKHVSGLSEHKTVGFNLFDKLNSVAGYISASGTVSPSNQEQVSDYISIFPNTIYYLKNVTNLSTNYCVAFYDADKQFISVNGIYKSNEVAPSGTMTSPSNARYMRVSTYNEYVDDVCTSISDPAKNGTYKPYKGHSYPLDDSLTLRGIPKLDSDNKLYFDGDRYLANGVVERRYGIVDLGTLTWSREQFQSSYYFFKATISQKALTFNFMTPAYINVENGRNYLTTDKTISTYNNLEGKNTLCIRDDSYSDATAFKTAMSGVMLVYELATPTTEEADPYHNPQIVDPEGTEEYVTTSIVPVGHETKYFEDLKGKLESLPSNFSTLIAPTEATYTATRNYTTGELLIVKNILYKVTSNIANGGTITPNTNVLATTLSEVIASLS